jgi:P4 family phage/plasmid primase-like protien
MTTWENMTIKNITMGTLVYMAKQDNPEEYSRYTMENMERYIKDSLNNGCSHNDIAKALHIRYNNEFRCASLSQNVWYQFENHRWKRIDNGVALSLKISDDEEGGILHTFIQKYREFSELSIRAENDGEKAMYNVRMKQAQKIIYNLKSAPFKKNVMKECMEIFYDENFLKKTDKNPFLVGFRNGVYDLQRNGFREGLPDDCITLQMPIEYIDFHKDDPKIKDVRDFLVQIFPDKSVRDYFMDISSEIFVGGNRQKHVYFWSGEGDNGKSVTQSIFEKMLGEYAVKLPTSLIVGKRTQSSAACPELVRAGNGVRWAVLQEPDKKDVINIGILKELSGNDTFFARGLYKEGSEIEPMMKIVVICNDPPLIPYSDKATWNRIRVIPFESTFCDDPPSTYEQQLLEKRFPKDPFFNEKIPSMIQALSWILLEHRKNGHRVPEPEKVKMATAYYKKKNDIYRQFIEESIDECPKSTLSLSELYTMFKEWHRESLPNQTIPIKNDVKEYFMRVWGDPLKGFKWKGYKPRVMEQEEIIALEEEDFARPPL